MQILLALRNEGKNEEHVKSVKRQVTYTTPVTVIVTPIHSQASETTAGLEGGLVPGGGGGIIPPVNPVSDIVKTFDYCGNAIYENNVLTTLLVDGGYVSFTKSGTGANATFTTNYLEGKILFRIFANESIFAT
ncbi:MAG: hypothetical protein IKX44_10310 [Prevotella sp.]|nr:hypothetical protein [Prevotella sp.]